MEQEILTAIKEDRLYDFIANNYYRISHETLRDLLLEIYYILRNDYDYITSGKVINNYLIESLKQNRDWEE